MYSLSLQCIRAIEHLQVIDPFPSYLVIYLAFLNDMRAYESENGTGLMNERYNVHLHRRLDLQQNPPTMFDYDTPQKYSGCGIGSCSGCVQRVTFFFSELQSMMLRSLSHQIFLQEYPVAGFDEVEALPFPRGFLASEDVGG